MTLDLEIDLEHLKKVAEAATQDPWENDWALDPEYGRLRVHPIGQLMPGDDLPMTAENKNHIATFDPPTVLKMIAEIERLREIEFMYKGLCK